MCNIYDELSTANKDGFNYWANGSAGWYEEKLVLLRMLNYRLFSCFAPCMCLNSRKVSENRPWGNWPHSHRHSPPQNGHTTETGEFVFQCIFSDWKQHTHTHTSFIAFVLPVRGISIKKHHLSTVFTSSHVDPNWCSDFLFGEPVGNICLKT